MQTLRMSRPVNSVPSAVLHRTDRLPMYPFNTPFERTETMRKWIVAVAAVAICAPMLSVSPADARAKKAKRYVAGASTSLDGRVTGYPRTCGYDYYLYDTRGIPVGPYCH